jgi:hypothetical protein
MQKIRSVLDLPIQKGYVNWPMLEKKLSAGIEYLSTIPKDSKVKVEDSIEFTCTVEGVTWAYKLFTPRLKDGALFCGGFMLGRKLAPDNTIWFPNSRKEF